MGSVHKGGLAKVLPSNWDSYKIPCHGSFETPEERYKFAKLIDQHVWVLKDIAEKIDMTVEAKLQSYEKVKGNCVLCDKGIYGKACECDVASVDIHLATKMGPYVLPNKGALPVGGTMTVASSNPQYGSASVKISYCNREGYFAATGELKDKDGNAKPVAFKLVDFGKFAGWIHTKALENMKPLNLTAKSYS